MKALIILLSVMWGLSSCSQGPEGIPIFSIQKDTVAVNTQFIDSLYFDYQNRSSFLFKSSTVFSPDKSAAYTIQLSNFKGTEGDGGYFRIIDVLSNGRNILSLKQSDGWTRLPEEAGNSTDNEFYFTIPLTPARFAVVFIGHPYCSQPNQLTIIVIEKGKGTLVYNKEFIIRDIQRTATSFIVELQDFPLENLDDYTPANTPKIFRIWSENGILKFGGPYGIVTY